LDVLRPPPPGGILRESLGVLELPRLFWAAPGLAAEPRGDGGVVLVFPGYGTGDASTAVLRAYLRWLGHRARGWGLGRNTGEVPELLARTTALVADAARRAGRPVSLIGWSLGGYLARETARERPDDVAHVVTLGSPVVGGPKYTAVADAYRRRGYDLDVMEAEVAARSRVPLRTAVTAIYSRTDGIVAWRACIDDANPDVEHVEVRTTHLGLGFAPEVYRIVARRLAARPGGGAA
jgi:pimeloyl-ACP methyl ester carboxylesterase